MKFWNWGPTTIWHYCMSLILKVKKSLHPTIGEMLQSLHLHLACPLTAACLLLCATSVGRTHHLPATWHRQTSHLVPTPGFHITTVAGPLAN